MLGQLLDRDATVLQDAHFPVKIRNGAGARTGIAVSVVQRDISRLRAQFRDIKGLFILSTDDYGEFVNFPLYFNFNFLLIHDSSVVVSNQVKIASIIYGMKLTIQLFSVQFFG